MSKRFGATISTLLLFGLLAAGHAGVFLPVADAVTVGTVSGPAGSTVNVPVFIRDVSGTPLGIDQPPGSRIQSFTIKVDYSPAASVQTITFTRGGITASLTPTFESSPASAGSISLIDTFQESTNLIPFTLNAPVPGNQVAVLHVTIPNTATAGSTIVLALDPALTQLTDQGGSGATKESVSNANLLLINGAINVTAPVPALSGWALALLALVIAAIAIVLTSRA